MAYGMWESNIAGTIDADTSGKCLIPIVQGIDSSDDPFYGHGVGLQPGPQRTVFHTCHQYGWKFLITSALST